MMRKVGAVMVALWHCGIVGAMYGGVLGAVFITRRPFFKRGGQHAACP